MFNVIIFAPGGNELTMIEEVGRGSYGVINNCKAIWQGVVVATRVIVMPTPGLTSSPGP